MSSACRIALFAALAAIFLGGAARAEIVVFAAASLRGALDDAAAAWSAASGEKAVVSYAATAALARQIEQGAPADIFISADLAWMDYLQERDLIAADSRRNLLGNRLVLVATGPEAAPVALGPGLDLAKHLAGERLAVADTDAVPAGRYARAALESLGAWDGVKASLAEAENVRAALRLVARGEAPLGIVYATDAILEAGVTVLGTFPPDSHPPILYPLALTADAEGAARGFRDFLLSPEARRIFVAHGFTPIG